MSGDWLKHQAVATPSAQALMNGGRSWTYAALHRLVAETAEFLSASGIQTGEHVAVLLPSGLTYILVIHALARLKAVLVPLNTRLTTAERNWQLEQADCAFLISHKEMKAATENTEGTEVYERKPVLSRALFLENLEITRVQRPFPIQHSAFSIQHSAAIVFTSGTTGKPKGAVLTYDNFFWGAMASAYRLGVNPDDRWLLCMPLYHVGGLAIVWRCCLYGITAVLHGRFDPQAVNQAIDEQGVTLVSLVPTMLQRVLVERQGWPFPPTLRCVLLGGAAAPQNLLEKCRELKVPVALTYGLTEATSQVATAVPADVLRKPGSVGKPLLFSAVQIVGEQGEVLLPGESGQILVNGPTVMPGYYRQPKATQQAIQDGWLHTGDMGYLDSDGDLWVVQRRSDLIVTGGENVYPAEVEQVLMGHSAVQAACVVGIPDETWGQKVAAAVVLHPGHTLTEADLIAHCHHQLAGYKQPRLVRIFPELPLTASGKIHREAVRTLFK